MAWALAMLVAATFEVPFVFGGVLRTTSQVVAMTSSAGGHEVSSVA